MHVTAYLQNKGEFSLYSVVLSQEKKTASFCDADITDVNENKLTYEACYGLLYV